MLKRSGFKRPKLERIKQNYARLTVPVHQARISGDVVACPKGEKAKPGKRAPTAAESEWMDSIVAYGCIACRLDGNGIVTPCVHHILRGGQRMGHLFTLPLCPGHHQDGYGAPGLLARHPFKKRFEQKYGLEDTLLEFLRDMLCHKISKP